MRPERGLPRRGSEAPADVELDEVPAEVRQIERAVATTLVSSDLDVVGHRDRKLVGGLPVDAGTDEGGVSGMIAEAQRVLLAQVADLAAEIETGAELPGERGADRRRRAALIGLGAVPDQVVRDVDGAVEAAKRLMNDRLFRQRIRRAGALHIRKQFQPEQYAANFIGMVQKMTN